jgi:hypothetical protein
VCHEQRHDDEARQYERRGASRLFQESIVDAPRILEDIRRMPALRRAPLLLEIAGFLVGHAYLTARSSKLNHKLESDHLRSGRR